MTRRRIYCGSCAKPLKSGGYLRCPFGCGTAVCRRNGACLDDHAPNNCPAHQERRGLAAVTTTEGA